MYYRRYFKRIFLCLLVLASAEAKPSNAIQYLNTLRTQAGLLPFHSNKALSKAAQAHAKYLTRQQRNGHYEKKGLKGFSGVTPTDRTLRAGYASKMVMENLSVNAKDSKDAIDNLMSAIYHRFVFFNTQKDEIGEGVSRRPAKAKMKTAFVYDLGSSALRKLCNTYVDDTMPKHYVSNVCKDSSKLIPQSQYNEKINEIRRKNAKIILYPYHNQENVAPAFFIEHPHPLPGSKVSGYPISVQFNEAYFKKVKLLSFRLFDEKGKECKKRKILTHLSDRNHKFNRFQFAFMPLKRLEYGMTYRVRFEAMADGKKIKKYWRFRTFLPQGKVYKIIKKKTSIQIKNAKKIVLYFEPRSRKDILRSVTHSRGLKVKYVDANTLEVRVPKRKTSQAYTIQADARKVILK